jgi:predicted RNase H-like nuclease (RuvC/YqgF family)
MGQDRESAAAEVERLERLRDQAERGSEEHRALNHELMKARRSLSMFSGEGVAADERLTASRRRSRPYRDRGPCCRRSRCDRAECCA